MVEGKQKTGKKVVIGILVIAFFAVFALIGWWNNTKTKDGERHLKNAVSVQIDEVKRDKVVSTVKAKGIVEIKKKESLYVNNPVMIDKILVEVGDRVEKEQDLIKYDLKAIEDLDQKLEQAILQLEIQELTLKKLMLPISESEIEKARSAIEQSNRSIEDAMSSLRQAEVNHEQNKRALEDAQKQYNKNLDLFKQGVISEAELDRFQEQLKTSEDRLEISLIQIQSSKRAIENAKKQKLTAEQNLNDLLDRDESESYKNQVETQRKQIQLQQLQIESLQKQKEQYIQNTKSPIKGTVLKIAAEEGTSANPGIPIIEIGDTEQLYIKADINEFDAVSIKEGQEVIITADALEEEKYKGVVQKVAPVAMVKQGSTGAESFIQVDIDFKENREMLLKPGYSVEIDITTKYKENTMIVPILALIRDKDGVSVVYIVGEDSSVEKREVKVGVYEDLYVEVEGVSEGETVIINPNVQIKQGDYVRPVVKKQPGDSQ